MQECCISLLFRRRFHVTVMRRLCPRCSSGQVLLQTLTEASSHALGTHSALGAAVRRISGAVCCISELGSFTADSDTWGREQWGFHGGPSHVLWHRIHTGAGICAIKTICSHEECLSGVLPRPVCDHVTQRITSCHAGFKWTRPEVTHVLYSALSVCVFWQYFIITVKLMSSTVTSAEKPKCAQTL